jgi:hypothetical protein
MGEYYVTGYFTGSPLNFYESNSIDISFNRVTTNEDIYLAKYNSNGKISWARQIGGSGVNSDRPVSIVTDNTHVYITGYYNDLSLNFYNSSGGIDASLFREPWNTKETTFIAKYRSNGKFLWATQIGGIVDQTIPISLVTDNTNIYILGTFYDLSLNFYNSNRNIGISLNKGSPSITDINTFVVKYNPYGNVLWARGIGGTLNERPISLVTDNTNIYLSGYFNSQILNFYNSNGNIDLSFNRTISNDDTFIVKYDAIGNIPWARGIGGSINDRPISLVTDNTNIYLSGICSTQTLNFYNSNGNIDVSFNRTGSVVDEIFIVKYNTIGNILWVRQIGGTLIERPISLVTDNINVYLSGYFNSQILNFYNSNGNIDLSFNRTISNEDMFIVKYNPYGNILWARGIGGTLNERPVSLVTDNTNVYLSGYFNSSILNFYNSNGNIDVSFNKTDTSTNSDTFIVKYDVNGNIPWARGIGGSFNKVPISLVTDDTNIYLSGTFQSLKLNFYNSNGNIDLSFNKTGVLVNTYIVKYDPDGNLSYARNIGTITNLPVTSCVTKQNFISNTCFLGGTLIVTDQGMIEIENITNDNTINNIKVKYITRITSNDEYLVSIEKNALCENIPSQTTVITKNHKILYNGNLIKADNIPTKKIIKYNGEILYNVLLEKNSFMIVNNLICETLDTNNVLSLLYDHPNKNGIIKTLNTIINTGNIDLYKKTAIELLS